MAETSAFEEAVAKELRAELEAQNSYLPILISQCFTYKFSTRCTSQAFSLAYFHVLVEGRLVSQILESSAELKGR